MARELALLKQPSPEKSIRGSISAASEGRADSRKQQGEGCQFETINKRPDPYIDPYIFVFLGKAYSQFL